MQCLTITQADGSVWAVPVAIIATSRATHYAHEFDGDVKRSLDEDTLPLFAADPFEVQDWASNNMKWSDVAHAAFKIKEPEPCDFQEAWVNGEKSVIDVSGQVGQYLAK